MSNIKIEKDVELPPSKVRYGRRKYPWDEMDVGDSFYAGIVSHGIITYPNISRAPKKFVARKDGDGTRIWRVE